jgi:superfamily I DNA/RNA helicase
VLLDESQDTNAARRALAMKMMKPRTGRMIFVGDPAQAIYGFTGADSDSMNQIKVALKAKTLPLSVTYRCPKAIVAKAQEVVPDIQAHDTNALGAVEYIDYKDMMDEALQSEDVILCRNTAPLIRTAYELLGKGIPCRVEGREIGSGLIKLATRWKINAVDKLLERLEKFFDEQKEKYIKKDQEEKVQALEDQVECLKIVISRCMAKGIHTVKGLVTEIESMFGNTKPGEVAKVLTLSTIHKSKGREWNRVFVLGNNKYLPSPYAKKDWQIQQERNLQYVADTRSKMELFHVAV